jgi:hypothetical protein
MSSRVAVLIGGGSLALTCLGTCATGSRAGDQATGSPNAGAAVTAAPSRFVTESRKTYRNLRAEIARLGSAVLHRVETVGSLRDQVLDQEITVKSAEANCENAKLTRDVAEIEVKVYEEGTLLQDLQTAQGELKLAESDLTRAEGKIESAKERLAAIKNASQGSAVDLVNEYSYEDDLIAAERRQPKAKLAIESARSKLEVLERYTRPQTVKRLNAEVEKTRAAELAKQSAVEVEKLKLKKLKAAIIAWDGTVQEERLITTIKRAIQLEDLLEARLDQVKNDALIGDSARAEIVRLLEDLEGTVESAKNEHAAAAWIKLKSQIPPIANGDPGAKPK